MTLEPSSLRAQRGLVRALTGQDEWPTGAGTSINRDINALVGRKPRRADRVLAARWRGAPAEGRQQVVAVDDARAGARDRIGHLGGIQAAAGQRQRRFAT